MNLGIGLGITNYQGVPTVPLDPDAVIAALFGSGEEGAWYDPSDLSTVWQDAAGTTPATAGDPVGRIDDKSGNGNHATQSTSTARPTLQTSGGLYYLDFDGVDDFMKSSSFTALSQPISTAVAFRSNSITDFIYDGHASNELSLITIDNGGVDSLRIASNASTPLLLVPYTDGVDTVARALYDGASSVLAINGVDNAGSVAATSDPTQWTLGDNGSASGLSNLDGRIYGFIGVNRSLTAGEIGDVESYLAAKSGVTL